MLRRISFALICCTTMLLLIAGPAVALDEDADSLGFLPSDAPLVLAVDMDELMAYANDVGDGWRDADRAHFTDGLRILSDFLTQNTGKPDVLTFFERLDGVQAFSIDPAGGIPLMVFSAGSELDARVLGYYTVAYIQERRLDEAVSVITGAIGEYYRRCVEDPETGESVVQYGYPESIDVLIEGGYLERMPINPYTGEPMRVVDSTEDGRLGDVYYEPLAYPGCCGACAIGSECVAEADAKYHSYALTSFRIGGTLEFGGWRNTYEPYDDLANRLLSLGRTLDIADMGFDVESFGGWTLVAKENADYAFGFGDSFVLFGKDFDEIRGAVRRYENGGGFHFTPPEDFNTQGAFYRDQADVGTSIAGVSEAHMGQMPPEIRGMMQGMFESIGIDAITFQHTAGWLRAGEIESVRRVELSGESRRSLVGSIAYAEPMELLTASGGPFRLIGEMSWANPDVYIHAYLDYLFEFVAPMAMSQMGAEAADPNALLSMVGLGDIGSMNFGDQLIVLLTASTEREDGSYWPGMLALLETDSPDLAYVAAGFMDSMSFMMPDFPFRREDFGDENAMTWVIDNEDFPITPTIAWTDGWIIKGMFREDVLRARESLEMGTLLMPDGMAPANLRLHANRQGLLRGVADVLYALPCWEASPVGSALEILARLSGPDEMLYVEVTGSEDYLETRCSFSTGLFEGLVPALAYIVPAVGEL